VWQVLTCHSYSVYEMCLESRKKFAPYEQMYRQNSKTPALMKVKFCVTEETYDWLPHVKFYR